MEYCSTHSHDGTASLEKSLILVVYFRKQTEFDIHVFWSVKKITPKKNMYIKYIIKHEKKEKTKINQKKANFLFKAILDKISCDPQFKNVLNTIFKLLKVWTTSDMFFLLLRLM